VSSILKALKKLEEEKVRRGERPVDLAVDIHRGGRRHRPSPLVPIVWVLLGVGLAGVATWLLRGPGPEKIPAAALSQPPASLQAPQASLPAAPVAPDMPMIDTPSAPVPPTSRAAPEPKPAAAGVRKAVPAASAGSKVPVDSQRHSRTHAPEARDSGREAKAPAGTDPSGLQLTGIVWQKDPASRMAIINDLPVMVGTDIEGVKVIEIHPNRVVVSAHGKKMELLLPP